MGMLAKKATEKKAAMASRPGAFPAKTTHRGTWSGGSEPAP